MRPAPIGASNFLMLPLLKTAADGKEHKKKEVLNDLAKHFGLTEEERKELLPSGNQEIFDNRVGWARTYLKKASQNRLADQGHERRAVLREIFAPTPQCNNSSRRGAVIKSRQGYKGHVIVARSYELQAGGFSSEFSVEEHEADSFMETEFYMPETFPPQESAIEAAVRAGRKKIDAGFERGLAVVNG